MKKTIAVSGVNSGIGKAVKSICLKRGIDVIELGRGKEDFLFDMESEVRPPSAKVDGFIHLAWDWVESHAESRRRNVENLRPFLDSLHSSQTRLVLLSTESASGSPVSNYGRVKRELEAEFVYRGGSSVRAGLIWGSQLSGIVATIFKLSQFPFFCVHLEPDPKLFVSNQDELASKLVELAIMETDQAKVISFKSVDPVALSEISHSWQGLSKKRLHIRFPLGHLVRVGNWLISLGFRLPFRIDSLRSLLLPKEPWLMEEVVQDQTQTNKVEFLTWVSDNRPAHQ